MLDRLERKLGRYALPRLTLVLAIGQLIVWSVAVNQPQFLTRMALIPESVMQGEAYRLLTFLFIPPSLSWVILCALQLFYVMGSALEATWGDFRYNLYVMIAYLATLAVAWCYPANAATNAYIGGSIFLAFAWLYPDFVINICFVLPVRVKWIALFTWIGFAMTMFFGDWEERALACCALANFFLFFGTSLFYKARYGKRQMERQIQAIRDERKPFHRCTVCGITEKEDRHMDFRYCSKCRGTREYCSEHLRNHEHVIDDTVGAA
ncbi:MAG TPA: hypothetical protein VHB77_16170 [Planctomycetaceae bacterium]|nr:hypothetical protein [Planctomycetaceae bacterium]